MKTVNVYSPVEDKKIKIKTHFNESPIWAKSYHEDELDVAQKRHKLLFKYTFKFNGLRPIQVTSVKRINS